MNDLVRASQPIHSGSAFMIHRVGGVDVKYTDWVEDLGPFQFRHTLFVNPDAGRSDVLGVLMTTEKDHMGDAYTFRIDLLSPEGTLIDPALKRKYGMSGIISGSSKDHRAVALISEETGIQASSALQGVVTATKDVDGSLMRRDWVEGQLKGLLAASKETPLLSADPALSQALMQTIIECGHVQSRLGTLGAPSTKPIADQSR